LEFRWEQTFEPTQFTHFSASRGSGVGCHGDSLDRSVVTILANS
jgi:hypothetical protein